MTRTPAHWNPDPEEVVALLASRPADLQTALGAFRRLRGLCAAALDGIESGRAATLGADGFTSRSEAARHVLAAPGARARTVRTLRASTAQPADRRRLASLGLGTLLLVPVRIEGGGRAVLSLGARREIHPSADALRLLLLLGRAAAAALVAGRARERAERLQVLFTAARDAMVVLDVQAGIVVDVNDHGAGLLGLPRTDLLGASFVSLVDDRDREGFLRLSSGLRGSRRGSWEFAGRLRRGGGAQFPAELTARMVRSGGRQLAIVIVHDVSRQKKAEVQLAASEDLLRIIVEGTLGMFFYVHNRQGVFTYVSPSVQRITGHAPEAWRGHYAQFLTDNPMNEQVTEHTERALREAVSPPPYHCEIRHADGRLLLLEINEKPILKDGEVIGIQGVARDITERRQWERTLMDSEARYRTLFHRVSDGIFSTDAQGRIVSINRAGAAVLGYADPDDMLARGPLLADHFAQPGEHLRFREALSASGSVRNMEFDGRREGAGRVVFEITATAVRTGDSDGEACDGTLRDVTERKRLEEQLLHSQKMESIGLLAGGIAHDFNNILGGILGYASYLKSAVPASDPMHQHLDTIERSALRAADLTAKLLAFARGGKYVIRPMNLNAVVDETLRLLRGSLEKSITIDQQCTEPLPAVEADAGQMQQVLMNLCVNARDAMPGGGRLTVSTAVHPWQTPFLVSQPDLRHVRYVRVRVQDTGVGIPKDVLSRIFEPFFTTKEKGKGTGLGLATVYGIVKNHNGFIEVQSDVGRGTTFSVWFPTVEADVAAAAERPPDAAGGSETILVVDDEDTIRSLVADLLGSRGYRVLQARNGREGLELYRQGGVDLVILDMMMPEMGGRETFAHLRELDPEVCTILSTGYSQDERARELLSMGVRAFVQKPYRADDLAAAVRSVLDARRQSSSRESDVR